MKIFNLPKLRLSSFVILLVLPFSFALADLKAGDVFQTGADQLHPTQIAVGYQEVKIRAKKLLKMSEDELMSMLKSEPLLVVIGPSAKIYIIDNHHLAKALLLINHPEVYAKVFRNWQNLNEKDFWQMMQKNKLVYLYDQYGHGPKTIKQLPDTIEQLKDDPWRSVAWFVRKEGGYNKTTVLYAEFLWARYFHSNLNFAYEELILGKDVFSQAVSDSLKIAHSPEASSLPGYISP